MQTNIYLIRHGEVDNPKQIIYGRLPRFGLSEKGIIEVKKAAEFLRNKNITAIYSSPLLRTRQTADILNDKLGINRVRIRRGLIEIKTSLEGRDLSKLDLMHLNYFLPPIWSKDYETIELIASRMRKLIETFLTQNKGKSVLAVSHGDPIMIIKAYLNNLPMTFSSIRPTKYLSHGEVTQIQQIDNQPITAESVFIPNV